MKLPSLPSKTMFFVLRITIGLIFISHGIARLYYGSVNGFGEYLNSQGLIIGVLLAWIITIGEIIFGSLLAAGIIIKYAVIFHAIIVVSGIIMIHIHHGWFVVGHGNNGVEYSLLLLAVLGYLYASDNSSRFKIK